MQEILERTDGKVRLWPATLYGTLKRLMDEDMIEESADRPAPEEDDARRRYYRPAFSGLAFEAPMTMGDLTQQDGCCSVPPVLAGGG